MGKRETHKYTTERNTIMKSEKIISSFIMQNLPKESNHSIIDVGANEDADFSRVFIEDGWKALLIEPQIELCQNLKNIFKDKDCIIINKACGDSKKETLLYLAKGGDTQLATLNDHNNEWFDMVRSETTVKVQCDTISNIIQDTNFDINFSVLKIDAESWDYFVLKGLDFSKYKPIFIISEDYFMEPENCRNKYYLLEDQGYVLLGWIEHNTLWRKRDKNINFMNILMRDYFFTNNIYPQEFGFFDIKSKLISP